MFGTTRLFHVIPKDNASFTGLLPLTMSLTAALAKPLTTAIADAAFSQDAAHFAREIFPVRLTGCLNWHWMLFGHVEGLECVASPSDSHE